MSDSIAKYVDNIRNCEVRDISGININSLENKIQAKRLVLDKEFTIFHVGTNNIKSYDVGEIKSCFNNLISVAHQHSNTKIVISAILPRPLDHTAMGEKVKVVNPCARIDMYSFSTHSDPSLKMSANKGVVHSE